MSNFIVLVYSNTGETYYYIGFSSREAAHKFRMDECKGFKTEIKEAIKVER